MTTDDRELLAQSIERFAARELEPRLESIEHGEGLPASAIEGLRELGLLELDTAGDGLPLLATAVTTLARTSAAPAALLLAHALARGLLAGSGATNGSNEIRARLLAEATLLAYPLYAEPALSTGELRVDDAGGELVLDGRVELVVGAPVANWLILPIADGELVVLDRDMPGVEVGAQLLTLGMRGCPIADVQLARVRVPHDRRLPVDVAHVAYRFRGPAAGIAAGVVARSVSNALNYAIERYQGGRNIVEHQQVRAMLAGVFADRALCRDAATRLSSDGLPDADAMALFIEAKERAARATVEGVQLLGGYGYMEDYGQERCMRDARQAQSLLGRVDVQRQEVVAAWLADGAQP